MCQTLDYSKKDCAGNKKALAARGDKNWSCCQKKCAENPPPANPKKS
jgi:hypothetical protein